MKNYLKEYQRLNELSAELGESIPRTMSAFGELHISSLAKGSLETKTKELIALGIAISVRCDGCIAYHVHDAIKAGASKEEIVETIGVSVLMGGGPSLVYGCSALEAVKQLMNTDK